MQIRNRLFSYPVYSSAVDDYIKNDFSFDYDVESNGETLFIKYVVKIGNKQIQKKLDDKFIKLTVLIECPRTAYRKLFVLNNNTGVLEIPSALLSSKVELCCLLIANIDFVLDKSFGINNDYKDIKFEVKKGFIVGYDNTYSFIVDKDKEDDFKASSIVSVVKKLDLNDSMNVDLDNNNKIRIQLSNDMYNMFVQLQGQDKLPVIHSMIVLPSLVYVIDQIKNNETRQTYEEYYWYRCIEKQLKTMNLEIDSDNFNKKSSLIIAQELLKMPVKYALENLTTMEGGE